MRSREKIRSPLMNWFSKKNTQSISQQRPSPYQRAATVLAKALAGRIEKT